MADHKIVRDGIELIGRDTWPDSRTSGFDCACSNLSRSADAVDFFLGVDISTDVLGGLCFSHIFWGMNGPRYGSRRA